MVVETLARFLPLGRLGAPEKVPRMGHGNGKALGPSCTQSALKGQGLLPDSPVPRLCPVHATHSGSLESTTLFLALFCSEIFP